MATYIRDEFVSGINNNVAPKLFPIQVSKRLRYESLYNCTLFHNYSGYDHSNPIVIMSKEINQTGASEWVFSRVDALDYKTSVMNNESRRDQGEQLNIYDYTLKSQLHSKEIPEYLYWIFRKALPFDINNANYMSLRKWLTRNLEYETLKTATIGLYPNILTANRNIAGTVPSWDRVVLPLPTDRATWHANTTLPTYFNAFSDKATTGPNNTGLSVDLILQAHDIAEDGGKSFETEARIEPFSHETFNDLPDDEYLLFIDPGCNISLIKDPIYQNAGLTRGVVIDKTYQPSLMRYGDYVAKIGNVHIIKNHYLKNFRIKSADGNKIIAWNLLVGAAAWVAGWSSDTLMGQETSERLLEKFTYVHDYRAVGVPTWPSRYALTPGAVAGTPSRVENSLLHVFCSVNS